VTGADFDSDFDDVEDAAAVLDPESDDDVDELFSEERESVR